MESQAILVMFCTLIVLVMFSAFFALSEVAFISLNKLRLRYLLKHKRKNADIVQRIVAKMDKLIATILVGNNFVNVAISAIGTAIFIYFFGNNFAVVMVATLLITLLILIFCEITPKIFAVKHAENVSLKIAWFMDWMIKILQPMVKVFLQISKFILKIVGEEPAGRTPLVTEEEIRLMIELGKEEGVLTDGERRMLHRIFEFGDIHVYEVMVPLAEIVAVNVNVSLDELLDLVIDGGHSRIPVYEEDLNNIQGIIYARELLSVLRNKKEVIGLRDLLHPPYFINGQKRVSELLREFQKIHVYMAIVTDDNKNTLGVVTLEDLLEEIVGEIDGDVS